MQVTLKNKHNILIASLEGELDHHSTESIRSEIDRAIVSGQVKHLIFDLSRLSFMDSSGIGLVIGRYKTMHSLGGRVAVAASGRMLRIIKMSGLTRLISVCQTVEEAALAVKEG